MGKQNPTRRVCGRARADLERWISTMLMASGQGALGELYHSEPFH